MTNDESGFDRRNILGPGHECSRPAPGTSPTPRAATAPQLLCRGKNFPIAKGYVPNCCQQGPDIYQVVPPLPKSPPGIVLGHREIGAACTLQGSSANCVDTACHYGPCGAFVAQTWVGTNAVVFHSTQQPHACGYEATTTGNQVVIDFPSNEPFTTQTPYAGVTSSCPFTRCLSRLHPAVACTINVVATGGLTGQTSMNPGNITLTGPASVTVEHETGGLTVTAVPTGANTRAVFSGACNSAGMNHQTITCDIPFAAPNPQLTVTYEP